MIHKINIWHGLAAGILTALACLGYNWLYKWALGPDFSAVVTTIAMISAGIISQLVAAFGYSIITTKLKKNQDILFNFLFATITIAGIISPFLTELPMEIEAPELFPGLTVPMHIFPAFFWFALKPLFKKVENANKK